jgi:GT2 family glycosyltransferase
MKLSIVIATLGFESLKFTIDSILKNKGDQDIEILVIGDVEEKLIKRYKKIKSIRHIPIKFEKWDLSLKRNLGFKEAKAEIVAFIDDDTKVPKGWIKKGMSHFKDKKVGIVSGPGVVPEDASFSMKLFGNTLASLGALPIRNRYKKSKGIERDIQGDKIIGCNMFIRKEVFKKIGGFKEELKYAEENDYAIRTVKAGYKAYRDNELYLFHYARSDFKKFFLQIFRFGAAKITSVDRRIEPFKPVYLAPLLALIYFPVFLVASFFSIYVLEFLLASLGLYLLFDLIAALEAAIRTKDSSNILLLVTIPYMHIAYGSGEFFGFLEILF